MIYICYNISQPDLQNDHLIKEENLS